MKHALQKPDPESHPRGPAASLVPLEILPPDSMADEKSGTALSSGRADSRDAIEAAWTDAARLAGLVKSYARAGTAAKALCGIRIRALREYYFGPRNANGGRPKIIHGFGPFGSWNEMLIARIGIEERTARNWIKMADVVEILAAREGISLRETCEKLPWDWTPEETRLIDTTVKKLTEDRTQRQLLQADFLTDLGYSEPERPNASNNPTGKNGGRKQIPVSPQQHVENLRTLARTALFGHDSKEHRPRPGSPAFWLNSLVVKQGLIGDAAHPAAALTKQERKEIYELLLKPFADAWKALLA